MTSEIRLEVPAQPEYGRLARVTVAGLGLRLGFTYSEVEDLRLALDEALIALLDDGPRSGIIGLVYGMDDDGMEVDVTGRFAEGTPTVSVRAVDRFERMVADLVDEARLEPDAFHIHLAKRRHAA
jgi:hypothetical protein